MKRPNRRIEAGQSEARNIAGDLIQTTLTPEQIRSYLLEAETGDIAQQAELFERMEEGDGELDAHLRTRKRGVASLGWQIDAADDTSEARSIADYCRGVVQEIGVVTQEEAAPVRGIRAALFDLLDAISKGFSVLEIDWETTAAAWTPRRLMYRPQRWFKLADDGESIRALDEDDADGKVLNPAQFIVHSSRARSGFSARTSLLRSCVRAFIVRHYGWKDWTGFAEVFGMPVRVGTLREGVEWDSEEAVQFQHAVAAMGMNMWAVVNEGNSIDTAGGASGEGRVFESLLEHASKEMTLAVLGQTLTSGGESGGSYALGQVHNQVRYDLLESDARDLEETLTMQLLRPIVLFNRGEGAPVPRWNIRLDPPVDLTARASVLESLSRAVPGFRVSKRELYQEYGLTEPIDDDDTLTLGNAATAMLHAGANGPGSMALNAAGVDYRVVDSVALDWLKARPVATEEAWAKLSPAGRSRAWYVKGLAPEQIAETATLMLSGFERGVGEVDFVTGLYERGLIVEPLEGGMPGKAAMGTIADWHARVVYRNNRWGATQASQFQRLSRDADVRPFWKWLTHNPCPICSPLSGNIAQFDSPFWAEFYPPLHHQCRCEVVSVSGAEIAANPALQAASTQANPRPENPDPDFAFNPGDAYYPAGGAPATPIGHNDAKILATLGSIS